MVCESRLDKGVAFHKMQGCGNDFVVIDNRALNVPREAMAEWARKVCRKCFGVGADGLIFLNAAPAGSGLDVVWDFYNADGSRAEMCGNGARCAAKLACLLGMAPERMTLGTDAGPVEAHVLDDGQVRVRLTEPKDLRTGLPLDVDGERLEVHFVNTGVPHAVVFSADVSLLDVKRLGRAIRTHEAFAPKGTNANFVTVKDQGRLMLRTYERGVEDETYACGTGACASAAIANALGLSGTDVDVTTTGGEVLGVSLEGGRIFLRGAAEVSFSGVLHTAAMGLDWPA
ncbi:Diaminopimelate epimerase [Fundidesulfovibrio magnetotacticus]|uniref:Diaminopimelate epimerase n=1 Tax=Fundidesulfovibrio magnetotacticus TaxID=2730080 RepID=A0A6V8LLD9_9BACT|nr:diaminopimelate epimerase [Fundidesulfovibrio magnetotacticus]GFK93493.1 Diaminopimelate epimerase [Fundidesulfovibrio magnetotacticus]